jgi:translation initiation factor 1 (eIF-1/SUI1)
MMMMIIIIMIRRRRRRRRKYVSTILGHHEIRELQKTPILDAAHILRKVLL